MTSSTQRRAVVFSAALATAAVSVAIGAGSASATETAPSPEPTPSVSVSPSPSPSPSESPSPTATTPKQAPKAAEDDAEDAAAGTAKVSGRVWHDTNKNGVQDKGEEPAKGFHVRYYASSVIDDDAERADPTDPDAGNAVTDEEGRYSFDAVHPTRALVAVDKTTDDGKQWAFSPKGQGGDRALDSDFSHGPDERPYASSGVLTLKPGDELVLDAGVSPVEEEPGVVGEVSGRVWHDTDHDGIQETGEPGVANVPVVLVENGTFEDEAARARLTSKANSKAKARALKSRATADEAPGDGFVAFAATDPAGGYVIGEVPTGDYVLAVLAVTVTEDGEIQRGWRITKFGQGDDRTKDSDVMPVTIRDIEAGLSKKIPVEVDNLGLRHDVDAGLVKGAPPAPGDGGGELPTTGFAVGGFLAAGLALVGGGVALTLTARRRRQA